MLVMYPGRVNSPVTRLASAIDDTQTTITVLDSSVFPAAPNLLVIGSGADAETCLYTNIVGNVLTVQRGFQGIAKAWEIDMYVARNFTEHDYAMLKANMENVYSNYDYTEDPTGFTSPKDIVVTYDSVARTITLTGTVVLLFKGRIVEGISSGWVSPAHSVGPVSSLFLKYDGTNFVWSTTPWAFTEAQIAFLYYESNGTFRFGLREPHGLMPWQNHEADHNNIGTVRRPNGGGDLDPASFVIGSNTAANRRPNITECVLHDEDIRSVLPALTTKAYTLLSLTGAAADLAWLTAQADIVSLSGGVPLYNEWSGTEWLSTELPSNRSMSVWVVAIPVTADAGSQQYRFVFLRGQQISTTIELELERSPLQLSLGSLASFSAEYTFIAQIVLSRAGTVWSISATRSLFGSRALFAGVQGAFLSAVTAAQVSYDDAASNLDAPNAQVAIDNTTLSIANVAQTASYTLAYTDKNRIVVMDAAADSIVTIPTTAVVAFPIGSVIKIHNVSDYLVAIQGDVGVTLQNFNTIGPHAQVTIRKTGANSWVLEEHGIHVANFNKVATQSIASDTPTLVTWSPVSDPYDFWNAGNPSRITIPEGVRNIAIHVGLWCSTLRRDRIHRIQILKNGALTHEEIYAWAGTNTATQLSKCAQILPVVAGDYFDIRIHTINDGAINIEVNNTYLQVEVL
jgi:hypothetical protein